MISRRDFLEGASLVALLSWAKETKAFATSAAPLAEKWLDEVTELARGVKSEALTQIDWRERSEALYARVPLLDLLKRIDFERLAKTAPLPNNGEAFGAFPLPEALFAKRTFYSAVAGFRKDRSIPPHGHNHLVSSFIVLQGELRGRHFNRLRDEDKTLVLAPSIDRVFKAGDFSIVTQDQDNVHWFTALTDNAFLIDIGVAGLKPSGTCESAPAQMKSGRVYVDVEKRERTRFTAPRLTEREAYVKYG